MKITIIGCGWLGFPLAKKLLSAGHLVYGSTTRIDKLKELSQEGIDSFLYDGIKTLPENIKDTDFLILNFPPSKSMDYPKQVSEILSHFSRNCKIIFTSSTSVYLDTESCIDESGRTNENHPVFLAEERIRSAERPYCILRLAGLIGGDRHPVKFMSGKTYEDGKMRVNLVHQEDVIHAIQEIMQLKNWNITFNLCYADHPSRSSYYTLKANEFGIAPPNFKLSPFKGKEIDGSFITRMTNFRYATSI